MKEKYSPHRYWMLILIFLAAFGSLWMALIVSKKAVESAESIPDGKPDPIWHSFRLTDEPVLRPPWEGGGVDIYENYILWAEGDVDIGGGTPSCDYSDGPASPLLQPFLQIPDGWADIDICLYDRHTGLVSHLLNSSDGDTSPAMHGDWVAFDRELIHVPRLFLFNIVTGQEIEVLGADGVSDPSIYGDWVAYSDIYGGQMFAYRISTDELFMLTPYSSINNVDPDIYEQTIVWRRISGGDSNIVTYDLGSQTMVTVSARLGPEWNPKIYGDIVVWDWNNDIYGYNLSTSQYMTITNDPFSQSMPDIYENLVVWRDDRHGRWDIYGIDLQTSEIFSVTDGTNPVPDIYYPDIWGNVVAWHGTGSQGAAAAIKMTNFTFLPLLSTP
jgi:beta propeller repeat protein